MTVIESLAGTYEGTGEWFDSSAGGAPLGHGYLVDGYCHYHLETGKAFVEASYRFSGDTVEVFGSSTKNAEGNYIAWKELLRRAA